MKNRYILWAIPLVCLLVAGLYFSGLLDATPRICIRQDEKIIFTDKMPSADDGNVMLCVPAAYSEDTGIVGHYSTGKGRRGISDYRYTTIHLDDATHFQQASLVKRHRPKTFSDKKLRYRRALCQKGGKYYIEHSRWPLTLDEFTRQLKDYDNAWNLDMGTYSYGWYRDENGKIHHLGLSTYWNKNKQTNWIVVVRRTPA